MTKHKRNVHKKPKKPKKTNQQMNLCYILLHDSLVSQTIARFLILDDIHIMSMISLTRNPWISMWLRSATFTHAELVPTSMYNQIHTIKEYSSDTVLPNSLTSL